MLTALILICSAAVAPNLADCTRTNASVVMWIPNEYRNPITCFVEAQAYLAETSFGQDLSADDRIKIVCERNGTAAAAK
jgi:hypothetical protein